ncbi:excisionase family DNA-binding protein [Alienimonas chondri]|uniref:Helix-turn-helix domain-containing protein n=1 Tax=Alienimonas chondri TaxID=2681879 RepID=A0ABX1VHL8_9PLAN|nr:excisionase family DNA-binding protein [Alienimonas chondri]NNJ27375.1 hypothetical protein [Alienimonas chondri]
MSSLLSSDRPPGSVRELLSPKQVAAAAGVSESTVKRLVDDGALKAEKTAGGHRRIRLCDALAWVRSRGCGKLNPEALAGAVPALEGAAGIDLCDRKAVLARYAEALEAGEETVTTGIAVALFVAGAKLPVALEEPVFGRFAELRARCDHPSRECSVLHRALANSIAAAGRLRDLICEGADHSPSADRLSADRPSAGNPSAPNVTLADVGYEVDSLPVHLAATVAAAAGCNVTNLGAGVPAEVLSGTIERLRPRYLWLSANGAGRADEAEVAAAFAAVKTACQADDVTLLTHGDAVPPAVLSERGVRQIDSLSALADLLSP